MFSKLSLASAAVALIGSAAMATPAAAQYRGSYYGGSGVYERGYDGGRGGYDGRRGYDERRVYRGYDSRARGYRGNRGCDNGDGGTVIGAIAGGLAGHELAGRRGDRATGTILGGVIGALAGRAIDRSDGSGSCRR